MIVSCLSDYRLRTGVYNKHEERYFLIYAWEYLVYDAQAKIACGASCNL